MNAKILYRDSSCCLSHITLYFAWIRMMRLILDLKWSTLDIVSGRALPDAHVVELIENPHEVHESALLE